MVDCLSKLSSVNSTNSNTTSWNNCEIRAKLRSTVKDSMYAAWKNVIKEVYKKTSAGGKSPTIYRTLDDLFLRAEIELLGRTIYSYAGEGSQYAYWAANNNDAARVKKSQNEAVVWAERSPAELYSEVLARFPVPDIHKGIRPTHSLAYPSASAFKRKESNSCFKSSVKVFF